MPLIFSSILDSDVITVVMEGLFVLSDRAAQQRRGLEHEIKEQRTASEDVNQ